LVILAIFDFNLANQNLANQNLANQNLANQNLVISESSGFEKLNLYTLVIPPKMSNESYQRGVNGMSTESLRRRFNALGLQPRVNPMRDSRFFAEVDAVSMVSSETEGVSSTTSRVPITTGEVSTSASRSQSANCRNDTDMPYEVLSVDELYDESKHNSAKMGGAIRNVFDDTQDSQRENDRESTRSWTSIRASDVNRRTSQWEQSSESDDHLWIGRDDTTSSFVRNIRSGESGWRSDISDPGLVAPMAAKHSDPYAFEEESDDDYEYLGWESEDKDLSASGRKPKVPKDKDLSASGGGPGDNIAIGEPVAFIEEEDEEKIPKKEKEGEDLRRVARKEVRQMMERKLYSFLPAPEYAFIKAQEIARKSEHNIREAHKFTSKIFTEDGYVCTEATLYDLIEAVIDGKPSFIDLKLKEYLLYAFRSILTSEGWEERIFLPALKNAMESSEEFKGIVTRAGIPLLTTCDITRDSKPGRGSQKYSEKLMRKYNAEWFTLPPSGVEHLYRFCETCYHYHFWFDCMLIDAAKKRQAEYYF
jgi:hypothetical protein